MAIEAPAGTTLGAVATDLTILAGLPGAAVYAGSRRLSADSVLGSAGLREGAVLGVGTPGPRTSPTAAALELRVVGGPAAGESVALRPGVLVIGRDTTADVVLDDPAVSRRHVALLVGADGVLAGDLGSTNGSTIDDVGVPTGREIVLPPGAVLRVGDSRLVVAGSTEPRAALAAGPDGTLTVRRPPRLLPPDTPVAIAFPAEPARRVPIAVPILGCALPVLLGVGMAVFLHAAQYLLFMLLSPLMLLAGAISDRRGVHRGRRRDRAAFVAGTAEAQEKLRAELGAEQSRRRAAAPDPAALRQIATLPGQRLWERRPVDPDRLRLRLGLADLPAELRVEGHDGPAPTVSGVPATVDLAGCGVLGIAGPPGPVAALLRYLVAQLAVLHSPDDLDLVVLAAGSGGGAADGMPSSDGAPSSDPAPFADRTRWSGWARSPDWAWLRWLPHLREASIGGPDGASGSGTTARVAVTADQRAARIAALAHLVDARSADRPGTGGWAGSRCVLVLQTASAFRDPALSRILAAGPQVGIHAVCLEQSATLLPTECGAVATLGGELGSRISLRTNGCRAIEDIVLDGGSAAWADEIGRALAPVRDVGADESGGVPAQSRLLDLLALPTPDAIADRWRSAGRTTRCVIGTAASGPVHVDLATDGPHALVAGTTGSGKSELLQTLVTSLAIDNRPDAMAFVLIDYKGGAAFRECARLPQVAGVVTDLDPHLTERAITSLTAELRRRERALADAGATDIEGYWSATGAHRHGAGAPAAVVLPRLVLVIDEFATLADELPDFVDGLVGIAMRGRSLGIHLILATQRPGGVVSPVIRANTNLRIALRVTDAAESRDVLDCPDAAAISATTPGRAVLRVGSEPPVVFQSARVGGHVGETAEQVSVRPANWLPAVPAVRGRPERGPEATRTELSRPRRRDRRGGRPARRIAAAQPVAPAAVRRGAADVARCGRTASGAGAVRRRRSAGRAAAAPAASRSRPRRRAARRRRAAQWPQHHAADHRRCGGDPARSRRPARLRPRLCRWRSGGAGPAPPLRRRLRARRPCAR